jgi:hypothetical protein
MLQTISHRTRDRFERNPYFHFHPMHSTFSLIAALALLGMIAWFLLAIR